MFDVMGTGFEQNNLESEKMKVTKKILAFRHQDKMQDDKNMPKIPDEKVALSDKGIKATFEMRDGVDIEGCKVKIIYSGRFRTAQTVTAIAASETDDGFLASHIGEDGVRAGEDGIDSRLDFTVGDTQTDDAMVKAFKDKRWLEWVVNESMDVSEKNGDDDFPMTYDRIASRVASLYLENLENSGDEKEALLMGSHQVVLETFLAKVIEKTENIDKRDAFVNALNKHGFDSGEGFEMDVKEEDVNSDGSLHIKYEKKNANGDVIFEFDKMISKEILEDIAEKKKDEVSAPFSV